MEKEALASYQQLRREFIRNLDDSFISGFRKSSVCQQVRRELASSRHKVRIQEKMLLRLNNKAFVSFLVSALPLRSILQLFLEYIMQIASDSTLEEYRRRLKEKSLHEILTEDNWLFITCVCLNDGTEEELEYVNQIYRMRKHFVISPGQKEELYPILEQKGEPAKAETAEEAAEQAEAAEAVVDPQRAEIAVAVAEEAPGTSSSGEAEEPSRGEMAAEQAEAAAEEPLKAKLDEAAAAEPAEVVVEEVPETEPAEVVAEEVSKTEAAEAAAGGTTR